MNESDKIHDEYMKENDIYKIENPGQFRRDEWKDSLDVVVAMKIDGRSASMAASGYENAEAIAYIMEQLKDK